MKKERLEYIDIAKAIGLLLIILDHAGINKGGFLALFHVSVFFIFSGFFFQDNKVNNPFQEIYKKIKGLYFPFVRYGIFFLLTLNFFSALGFTTRYIGSVRELGARLVKLLMGWEIYSPLATPLWFLPCLLFTSICFILFRYCVHTLPKFWKESITIVWAIGCYSLAVSFSMEWVVGRVLLSIPLYYIGFLIFRYKDYIQYTYFYGVLATLILFVLSIDQSVGYFGMEISDPIRFIPTSIIGAYLILFVSQKIGRNKVLVYIGQNTIPIIALHLLSFKLVTAFRIAFFDLSIDELEYYASTDRKLYLVLIYTFVGVVLPLLLHFLMNKIFVRLRVFFKSKIKR